MASTYDVSTNNFRNKRGLHYLRNLTYMFILLAYLSIFIAKRKRHDALLVSPQISKNRVALDCHDWSIGRFALFIWCIKWVIQSTTNVIMSTQQPCLNTHCSGGEGAGGGCYTCALNTLPACRVLHVIGLLIYV